MSDAAEVRASARPRRCAPLVAVLAALIVLASAASAHAWVYTDIVGWSLTESWSTYSTYSISSSGDGSAYYRWVDDPNHSTQISGNSCNDLSQLGRADIPAHDTAYYRLFGGYISECFFLRGRVVTGAGSMSGRDGRLRR